MSAFFELTDAEGDVLKLHSHAHSDDYSVVIRPRRTPVAHVYLTLEDLISLQRAIALELHPAATVGHDRRGQRQPKWWRLQALSPAAWAARISSALRSSA